MLVGEERDGSITFCENNLQKNNSRWHSQPSPGADMRNRRFLEPKLLALIALAAIVLGGAVLFWNGPFQAPGGRLTGPVVSAPLAPAMVKITPALVQQGGKFEVSGSGFLPGEAVDLQVSKGSANSNQSASFAGSSAIDLAHTQANLQGSIPVTQLSLPDSLNSGIHPAQLFGQISHRTALTLLYVHAKKPWITVGSSAVKPASTFGFVLGGFAPNEQVEISLKPATSLPDGQTQDSSKLSPATALASIPTDRVGNAVWTKVKLPLAKPGGYELVAHGASSGKQVTWVITVQPLTPFVELSPWSGPPGGKVNLNARGFAPNEAVDVFVGQSAQPALTLNADQYGNLWGAGPVQAPYDVSGGSLLLRVVGQASGASCVAKFAIQAPKPWVELTQYWGMPGTPVGFSGGGWAADEQVTFHLGSSSGPEIAAGQTDDYGWIRFGGTGSIPGDAQGTVALVGVGSKSHATASATFKVVDPFANQQPTLPAPPP